MQFLKKIGMIFLVLCTFCSQLGIDKVFATDGKTTNENILYWDVKATKGDLNIGDTSKTAIKELDDVLKAAKELDNKKVKDITIIALSPMEINSKDITYDFSNYTIKADASNHNGIFVVNSGKLALSNVNLQSQDVAMQLSGGTVEFNKNVSIAGEIAISYSEDMQKSPKIIVNDTSENTYVLKTIVDKTGIQEYALIAGNKENGGTLSSRFSMTETQSSTYQLELKKDTLYISKVIEKAETQPESNQDSVQEPETKTQSGLKAAGEKNVIYWNPVSKDITSPEDDQILIHAGSDKNDGSRADIPVLSLKKAKDLASGGTIICMSSLVLGSEDAVTAGVGEKNLAIDGGGVTIQQWIGSPEDIFVIGEGTTLTLKNINVVPAVGYEEATIVRIVKGTLKIDEKVVVEGQIQTELDAFSAEYLSPIEVITQLPESTKYVVYYSEINGNLVNQAGNVVVPNPNYNGLLENFILSKINTDAGWILRYQAGDEVEDPMVDKDKLNKNILELFQTYTMESVFVNGATGNDKYTGMDCSRPVKTFARAKQIIKDKTNGKGNIFVCDTMQSTKSEVWSLPVSEGFSGKGKIKPCRNYKHKATTSLINVNDGHTIETSHLYLDGFADKVETSEIDTSHNIANNITVSGGGTYIMGEGTINVNSYVGIYANGSSISKANAILKTGQLEGIDINLKGNNANYTLEGIEIVKAKKDSIIVEDSNITVLAGSIRNSFGYAIRSKDSKITINGGEISSNGISSKINKEKDRGAIYVNGASTLIINGGKIEGNEGSAGTIYGDDTAKITIAGGTISANASKENGGAISLAKQSKLTLSGGLIEKNQATKSGGAIYAMNDSTIKTSGGTIRGNTAESGHGGAIAAIDNSLMQCTGLTYITGNSAYQSGGGLYINTPKITDLSLLEIKSNKSRASGVGIYAKNDISMDKIKVEGNTGTFNNGGGGIYCEGNLVLKNSQIIKNSVLGNGGGMYVKQNVDISNSTINENRGSNGAGIYSDGTITLDVVTVEKNSANSNYDTSGGGIYGTRGANIKGSTIKSNTVNGTWKLNYGSGLFIVGSSTDTLIITDSEISENANTSNVSCNGVGIYATIPTKITNSKIQGNYANYGYGGGIYIANSLTLNNTLISGNRLSGGSGNSRHGGGVYITGKGSSMQMKNGSLIEGNEGNIGGGVFAKGCQELTDLNIISNTAILGGGLYTESVVKIDNLVSRKNQASKGGGIYLEGTSTTLYNYSIKENSAKENGGGVFSNCVSKFYDGSITGNTAINGGASLYTLGEPKVTFYKGTIESGKTGGRDVNGITINGETVLSPNSMNIKDAIYIEDAEHPLRILDQATSQSKVLPISLSSDFKNGSVVVTYESPITDVSMTANYFKGGSLPKKTMLSGYKKNVILIAEGVYLDGTDGDDKNGGTGPLDAVKTYVVAEQKLRNNIANVKNDGDATTYFMPHIYICGQVEITNDELWKLDYKDVAFQQSEDPDANKPEVRRFVQYRGIMLNMMDADTLTLQDITIDGLMSGINGEGDPIEPMLNVTDGGTLFVNEGARVLNNYVDNIYVNNGSVTVQGKTVGGMIGPSGGSAIRATNDATVLMRETALSTDTVSVGNSSNLTMEDTATISTDKGVQLYETKASLLMTDVSRITEAKLNGIEINGTEGDVRIQDNASIKTVSDSSSGIHIGTNGTNKIVMTDTAHIVGHANNKGTGIKNAGLNRCNTTILLEKNAYIKTFTVGIAHGNKNTSNTSTLQLTMKNNAKISDVYIGLEMNANFDAKSTITMQDDTSIVGLGSAADIKHVAEPKGIQVSDVGNYYMKNNATVNNFHRGVQGGTIKTKFIMSENSSINNNLVSGMEGALQAIMKGNSTIHTNNLQGAKLDGNLTMMEKSRIYDNPYGVNIDIRGSLTMQGESSIDKNKEDGVYYNINFTESAGTNFLTMMDRASISNNGGNGIYYYANWEKVTDRYGNVTNADATLTNQAVIKGEASIYGNGQNGVFLEHKYSGSLDIKVDENVNINTNYEHGVYIPYGRFTTISIGGETSIVDNFTKGGDDFGKSIWSHGKVNLSGKATIDDEIYMAHPKRNITLTSAVRVDNIFIVGYPENYLGVDLVVPDKVNISDASIYYDQFTTKNIPGTHGIEISGVNIYVGGVGNVYIAGDGIPTDELCAGEDTNSGNSPYFPVRTFQRAKEVMKTKKSGSNLVVCNFSVDVRADDAEWSFDEGGTVSNGKESWVPRVVPYSNITTMITLNKNQNLTTKNIVFGPKEKESRNYSLFYVGGTKNSSKLSLLEGTIIENFAKNPGSKSDVEIITLAGGADSKVYMEQAIIRNNILSSLINVRAPSALINIQESIISNNETATINVYKISNEEAYRNVFNGITINNSTYANNTRGNFIYNEDSTEDSYSNNYAITVTNNTFIENTIDGPLFYASHGNINDKSGTGTVIASKNTVNKNTSNGFIKAYGKSLTMDANTMEGNTFKGDAIYSKMQFLDITGNKIKNNVMPVDMSAIKVDEYDAISTIRIKDSEIEKNQKGIQINGINNKSEHSISNTKIFNNAQGGLFLTNITAKLDKVDLYGNTGTKGAGLYMEDSKVTGTDVNIYQNTGDQGSGVYMTGTKNTSLKGANIYDNQSTDVGAGVYINADGHADFSVSSSKIDTNSATHGAGLYATNTATILDSTISNNKAAQNGGGIYVASGTVSSSNVNLKTNEAVLGGGIYIGGGSYEHGSGSIEYNHATSIGGAIYVEDTVHSRITNGSITDNTAKDKAAAVYYQGDGRFEISGAVFDRNTLSKKSGELKYENAPIYVAGTNFQIKGGAAVINERIYLSDKNYPITLTGSIYQKNRYYLVDLGNTFGKGDIVVKPDNSVITNAAQYHKYFYVDYPGFVLEKSTPNLILKQCIFIDGVNGDDNNKGSTPDDIIKTFERALELGNDGNYIIYACGPIFVNGTKTWKLPKTAWISRYTGFSLTGVVYPRYDGDIVIVDDGDNLIVEECSIYGRRELDAESAVESLIRVKKNASLTMGDKVLLSRNSAKDVGGAIYIEDGGNTLIKGGSIEGTTALKGNAIYQGGKLQLDKNPKIEGDIYLSGLDEVVDSSKYIDVTKDYVGSGTALSVSIENPYNLRKIIEYPTGYVANDTNINRYVLDDSVRSHYEFKVRKGESNVLEIFNRDAIYIDGTGVYGDDTHDGKTPVGSVKTLKRAYEILETTKEGGIVIIVGTVNISDKIRLKNYKEANVLKGVYNEGSISIDAGGTVSFQRYAKPTEWKTLANKELYDVPNLTDTMFSVDNEFELDNVIIDGHSKETTGSIEYTAKGVEVNESIIEVGRKGRLYTKVGTNLINNNNVLADGKGGAIYINGGIADLEGTNITGTNATRGSAIYQDGELLLSRQPIMEGSIYLTGSGTKVDPRSSKYISVKYIGFMPLSKKITVEVEDPYENRTIAKYPDGTGNSIQLFDIELYSLSTEVTDIFYLDKRIADTSTLELKLRRGIYLDGVSGKDTNSGLAPDTSVRTLEKAYELVKKYRGASVFVVDTVSINSEIDITQHKYSSNNVVDLQTDNTRIYRYVQPDNHTSFTGFTKTTNTNVLFKVERGGIFTVQDLFIDGHKSPRNTIDVLNTQQVSTSTKVNSPLIQVDVGAIINLNQDAYLMNNNNATGLGGAIVNEGALNFTDAFIKDNEASKGSGIYQNGEAMLLGGIEGIGDQEVYLAATNIGTLESPAWDDKVLHIQDMMKDDYIMNINMDHAIRSRNVIVYDTTHSFDEKVQKEVDHFAKGVDVPNNLSLYESIDDTEVNVLELFDPMSVVIKNIWQDVDNIDGKRPEKINVDLYREDTCIATVELNEENDWRMTIDELFKYAEPKYIDELSYTIRQDDIKEYTTVYNQKTLTITNTYVPTRSVVYEGNGNTSGKVPVDDTKHVYLTDAKVCRNEGKDKLEKKGYIFGGWNTKSDGTGTHYDEESVVNIDDNKKLYAMWIEFTKSSVEENQQDILKPQEKITYIFTLKIPENVGKIHIKDALSNKVSYVESSNSGVYDVDTHTITWDLENVKKDRVYRMECTVGVNETTSGETIYNVGELMIGKNKYQSNQVQDTLGDTYRIYYNLNGGKAPILPDDKRYYISGDIGKVMKMDKLPQKLGYTFIGWSMEKDTGQVYKENGSITITNNDIHLFARYTKISETALTADDSMMYGWIVIAICSLIMALVARRQRVRKED